MIEMLTKKAGPIPVWGWFLIGVGGLALYMIHKNQAAAMQKASSQTGTTAGASNVLNPQNAAALSQGAGAMPYMGGDIYNNVAVAANPAASATATAPADHDHHPVPPPVAQAPQFTTYTVKKGDTLSSIAQRFGTTWQTIWAFNTTPGVRSAQDETELEEQGPDLIYPGATFLIPTGSAATAGPQNQANWHNWPIGVPGGFVGSITHPRPISTNPGVA